MKITQKHIEAARKAEAAKSAKVEETTKVETRTEKIIAAAAKLGKVWEKGGKVRIYLDADKAMEAAGWEVSRYQSGAIMSAKKDGEKVSNTKAGKVSMSLYGAYIDAVTGEVVCEDAEIRAAIEAIIAETLKPAEAEEAEAEEVEEKDVKGPSGFSASEIYTMAEEEYHAAGLEVSPEGAGEWALAVSKEAGWTEDELRKSLRGFISEEMENREEEEE